MKKGHLHQDTVSHTLKYSCKKKNKHVFFFEIGTLQTSKTMIFDMKNPGNLRFSFGKSMSQSGPHVILLPCQNLGLPNTPPSRACITELGIQGLGQRGSCPLPILGGDVDWEDSTS